MRFKVGQEIVCLYPKDGWYRATISGKSPRIGPDKDEICVVKGYEMEGFVLLDGYSATEGYHDICFEPVMDIGEIKEALKSEMAEA